jgi:hypothetical protein
MNYPPDFVKELKDRAEHRCECERRECHQTPGRCTQELVDAPAPDRWSPVRTGERLTFPPVALDYIALCATCAVPRTAPR